MSTEKGPAIKGNAREGAYTETWRAANDILEAQTYGKLVNLHGEGLKAIDAFLWADRVIDISTRGMRVIEEGHFWNTITTSAQVSTTSAEGAATIVSNDSIRVGFSIRIPVQYLSGAIVPEDFRITSKSGTGPFTYTCDPFLATTAITTAIPQNTELMVGASSFAAGTQQPASAVQDFFEHSHETRIMKDTVDIEGGQVALKELSDLSGSQYGTNLRARAILLAQLRLRLQQNDFLLMGYPNTNDLAQNNRHGESNKVLSDYGLIPAMAQPNGAMKQYYTGSYGEESLESVKFLLASQGLSGTNSVLAMLGQEVFTGIQRNMRTFLREYSGGTNLYYDNLNKVGFGVREIMLNNTTFRLIEIPEFSDPTRYAAPGLNFETMGMFFPDSKVTGTLNGFDPRNMTNAASRKVSVGHINMGFLNYNGENRKMIVANKAGVNGLGIPVSDDWDDSSTYLLTEMMNLFFALNQTILVLKTD